MRCPQLNAMYFPYNVRCVRQPLSELSEGEIIDLQDMFLTSGIHQLKVDSVENGRLLIAIMLESLNYYQNSACLTVEALPLDRAVGNVYQELNNSPCLELFFLEQFHVDFLWIEMSDELRAVTWYPKFQEHLQEIFQSRQFPILELLW